MRLNVYALELMRSLKKNVGVRKRAVLTVFQGQGSAEKISSEFPAWFHAHAALFDIAMFSYRPLDKYEREIIEAYLYASTVSSP